MESTSSYIIVKLNFTAAAAAAENNTPTATATVKIEKILPLSMLLTNDSLKQYISDAANDISAVDGLIVEINKLNDYDISSGPDAANSPTLRTLLSQITNNQAKGGRRGGRGKRSATRRRSRSTIPPLQYNYNL